MESYPTYYCSSRHSNTTNKLTAITEALLFFVVVRRDLPASERPTSFINLSIEARVPLGINELKLHVNLGVHAQVAFPEA